MEDKKQYQILLCEDDTNLGMVLKNYLELNEYEVTLERDGRLGLAAFQREKGIWIIKPVASSQGKGIFLINHVIFYFHCFQ